MTNISHAYCLECGERLILIGFADGEVIAQCDCGEVYGFKMMEFNYGK